MACSEVRRLFLGGYAENTDGQLSNRIIDDVESVAAEEVQSDFADEGHGVYHAGLDDDEKNCEISEASRTTGVL